MMRNIWEFSAKTDVGQVNLGLEIVDHVFEFLLVFGRLACSNRFINWQDINI